jgi:hypothetical protein
VMPSFTAERPRKTPCEGALSLDSMPTEDARANEYPLRECAGLRRVLRVGSGEKRG